MTYLTLLTDPQITKHQFNCLLATANLEQLNGLCEFFYNVISGHMTIDITVERMLKRHSKLLTTLTNRKNNSYRKRMQIIRRNIKTVSRIVKKLVPYIKKVLNHTAK